METRTPGRPRSVAADAAIIDAALDLLAERGFEAFRVEEVASRANVGKATIYRRFATREELIDSALDRITEPLPEIPMLGSTRERLVWALQWIRATGEQTRIGAIGIHAMTEARRHPELHARFRDRVLAARWRWLQEVIDDGVAAGDIRRDIDASLATMMLIAPVIYTRIWNPQSPAFSSPESLVDAVLDGIGRR